MFKTGKLYRIKLQHRALYFLNGVLGALPTNTIVMFIKSENLCSKRKVYFFLVNGKIMYDTLDGYLEENWLRNAFQEISLTK